MARFDGCSGDVERVLSLLETGQDDRSEASARLERLIPELSSLAGRMTALERSLRAATAGPASTPTSVSASERSPA